jgi:hypothetical protein
LKMLKIQQDCYIPGRSLIVVRNCIHISGNVIVIDVPNMYISVI